MSKQEADAAIELMLEWCVGEVESCWGVSGAGRMERLLAIRTECLFLRFPPNRLSDEKYVEVAEFFTALRLELSRPERQESTLVEVDWVPVDLPKPYLISAAYDAMLDTMGGIIGWVSYTRAFEENDRGGDSVVRNPERVKWLEAIQAYVARAQVESVPDPAAIRRNTEFYRAVSQELRRHDRDRGSWVAGMFECKDEGDG